MYFELDEIKALISDEYTETTEDALSEIADTVTPVYYSDVIKDWAEMPSEFNDSWKEYGYNTDLLEGGILSLMAADLYFYNFARVQAIWSELKEEADNEAAI